MPRLFEMDGQRQVSAWRCVTAALLLGLALLALDAPGAAGAGATFVPLGTTAWLPDEVLALLVTLAVPAVQPLAVAVPLMAAVVLVAPVVMRQNREPAAMQPAAGTSAHQSKLPKPGRELAAALASCKGALGAVFLFSALSNLLMLTGSIFMLEVYDRVLPSRSVPTLVALALIALFLFAVQGLLDAVRARILVRAGSVMDSLVGRRVHDVVLRLAHRQPGSEGLMPLRDLDAIRGFLSGPGPGALLDLPWLPFYLVIIFLFHPVLGLTALLGAVVLVAITAVTEFRSRGHVKLASGESAARQGVIDASRRNAEVIAAMGMGDRQSQRFAVASEALVRRQNALSDVTGGLGSLSRTLRMVLQSAMLAVGALLVIEGEASGGIIIAGSILVSRALAPVDQVISQCCSRRR